MKKLHSVAEKKDLFKKNLPAMSSCPAFTHKYNNNKNSFHNLKNSSLQYLFSVSHLKNKKKKIEFKQDSAVV